VTAPFLKWAGGKRWLASSNRLPRPDGYDRYIEPFLGGGAVFFALRPTTALLADINLELINLYRVIRDQPIAFKDALEEHQRSHSNAYYYQVRDSDPEDTIGRAARMLYLNRTCWNGLYRVNKNGAFNVPRGTKDSVVMSGEDFSVISEQLNNAELCCEDFEQTIDKAQANDFLFVDPPYTVNHNANGFLKYNEKIFSWSDQVRLHAALLKAGERGVSIVVTNADHETIHDLYEGFAYTRLDRSSILSAKKEYRGKTSEALFSLNL
jgi:DNA adenine methylase